jgi:hypothetical protein
MSLVHEQERDLEVDMRRTIHVLGTLLLMAGFTACSGDETNAAAEGSPCAITMQAASEEPDASKANSLIDVTLRECSSADEWLDTLRQYPAAVGASERAEISQLDLRWNCLHGEGTPVCEDAKEQGLIP